MAILKQRIKKKNNSGTYDTLHIETNSNLVLMDNGNTLQYEMYNHSHTKSQITNFPTSMTPTSHTHPKSQITDFPSTMPPSWHQHYASDILNLPSAGIQMTSGNYTGNNVNGRTINIGVSAKFCFIISAYMNGAILVQNNSMTTPTSGVLGQNYGYGILSGTNIVLYNNYTNSDGYPVNRKDFAYSYYAFY